MGEWIIKELGEIGEKEALILFKKLGFEVQSPDWVAIKNNQCFIIEAKYKERFKPPPFEGHGLDKRQIYLRTNLFKKTKIRTYLIVFEKDSNNIFASYLDELEEGEYFDTKNDIRIYPLYSFSNITKIGVPITFYDKKVVEWWY